MGERNVRCLFEQTGNGYIIRRSSPPGANTYAVGCSISLIGTASVRRAAVVSAWLGRVESR